MQSIASFQGSIFVFNKQTAVWEHLHANKGDAALQALHLIEQ
jgi:hypothetical protein